MLLFIILIFIMCCEEIITITYSDSDLFKERKYFPKVSLLKPKGFSVSIQDAKDIRQMHIFWNLRKPYNRSEPYSSTDFTNVTFNDHFEYKLTVSDHNVQLRIGDSIFYWLLLITQEWQRISLHKLNFWVKFDGVPEHFAETYYRDYQNYHTDEL